ncbi:helix-turn-helix domain-containing protein [Sulfitobacter dubius]|uniref:helix-turn-helix domain-containing protein n=1 Tax=Sulfitobacter dubius TaxID=218673 RepID=UPI0008E8515C|nr:XRE family transcriptional regulator [Sulfitobacter dubius]SFH38885.1 Zn-dependent peptidase ImmA, M78 family [Sulfitobacter dubius]
MKRVEGFIGERLTQARESRGLTKTALSGMLEISTNALAALETGASLPRQETFEAIADKTAFPRQFFLRSMPPPMSGPVFWRRQASEPLRSQNKTSQRIEWGAEAFAVLSEYVDFPDLNLPRLEHWPENWASVSNEKIEDLADHCRDIWGIGSYPIPDMCLALENIGIPILAFEIENEKQSGYSRWADHIGRPIVGTNTLETSAVRMRFNLAHELYHALAHFGSVTEKEVRHAQTYQAIEKQAHRFAGALLFPREAFLKCIQYPSLEEFASHKQEWGISILAQIRRAQDLGLCDPEWARALNIRASKNGYRGKRGEPFDKEMPLEMPRMFRRAVEAIEAGSELLLGQVRQRLSLPRSGEMEIFGRPLAASGSNVIQLKPIQEG